jgi:hypothetical protein
LEKYGREKQQMISYARMGNFICTKRQNFQFTFHEYCDAEETKQRVYGQCQKWVLSRIVWSNERNIKLVLMKEYLNSDCDLFVVIS